jgi:hypothetical protein
MRPPAKGKWCDDCKSADRLKRKRNIKPIEGKKRGRKLRTESGAIISHEEIVNGLIKKTAAQIALDMVVSGTCACGIDIRVWPGKGAHPTQCDSCAYFERLAKKRARQNKPNAVPKRKANVPLDLAAAKQLIWRQRAANKARSRSLTNSGAV